MRRAAAFLSIALLASPIGAATRKSKKKHTARIVRTTRSPHASHRKPLARVTAPPVAPMVRAAAVACVKRGPGGAGGSPEKPAGRVPVGLPPRVPAVGGPSHGVWFEGTLQDYESDRSGRLGSAADQPHRSKYRKLTR